MLRLIIIRHVSAGFAKNGQKDIERVINETGKVELNWLATAISTYKLEPDFIYCSPATRTHQTLEGIQLSFTNDPEIEMPELLYACMNEDYFNLLRAHSTKNNKQKTLMIIGHNPMCAGLTSLLVGSAEKQAQINLAHGFREGTIADMLFTCDDWHEIDKGSAHLARFENPHL